MKRKTILIEGVRYYADKPRNCRGCYFWKNRKVGCTLGKPFMKRFLSQNPGMRKSLKGITAASAGQFSRRENQRCLDG